MKNETQKTNEQPVGDGNFVTHLVTDPANIPSVQLIVGYLGHSAEANHIRLYANYNLTDYVDVPAEAILHKIERDVSADPLQTAYLWIRTDARLLRKGTRTVGTPQGRASFLTGAIQQNYMNPHSG